MALSLVSVDHVCIVRQVLTENELFSLNELCRNEYVNVTCDDLCDRSCALDPFENVILGDADAARVNTEAYMMKRAARTANLKHTSVLKKVLFQTFPTILSQLQKWNTVYLFNEHFVVKPPMSEVTFGWHTDAEKQLDCLICCGREVPEYCAVWCPLVDANAYNGALVVPVEGVTVHSLVVENSCLRYIATHDDNNANMIDGVLARVLTLSAGDIVIFSSNTLHCSGPNTSTAARNVFYAQYSPNPISADDAGTPLAFAVECIVDDKFCHGCDCDTGNGF